MIGQTELNIKLNNISLDNLPQSLIICGKFGCGKHLLVSEISSKLGLETINISNSLSDSELEDIKLNVIPAIYTIEGSELSIRDYQKILKFLEEPSQYMHTILICESLNGLPDTIINRCKIWKFEKYSREDLSRFINPDTIISNEFFNIFDTPGQILNSPTNIDNLYQDAEKIFKYIDKALISNILVLPEKLSFSEKDPDKINFNIFLPILVYVATKMAQTGEIPISSLLLTKEFESDCKTSAINKKKLYENYLISLKNEIRKSKATN